MKLKSNSLRRLFWMAAGANLLAMPMVTHAAATDLANAPMAVANLVPSNIMFTLDNSGGVDVDVLLPNFNSLYLESNVTNTNKNNLNGFFYLFPNAGVQRDEPQMRMGFADSHNPDKNAWRAFYYGYNKIYYNPYITYNPWPGNDDSGTPFTNATPTAVRIDPYQSSGNTYNITKSVTYSANTFLNSSGTACAQSGCSANAYRTYQSTIYPASYFVWKDTNNNGVMDPGEGVLYQISSATTTYPSGRTWQAELQNFANWFQYYRTPFLALKGYMGQSLSIMSSTNVGVIDLWHTNPNAPVSSMASAANVSQLQNAIYSITATPSDWTQPLHERTWDVWNYFNTPANSTNPPTPIQYSCQQNFNILVSPGYLNDNGYNNLGATGWSNDQTGDDPPPISTGNYDGTSNSSDTAWSTSPYTDNYGNTLADWTAYYYDQTLRTDLPAGQVPISAGSRETNTNLHMTTYVLAPGAIPQISVDNPNTPLANAQTADIWDAPYSTQSTTFAWPQPCFVCQNTVDDMWHAAVNGRGIFVNSSDIYGGLQTIVNNILNRGGAAASIAVANTNVTPTSNASYFSGFVSGSWSGNLGSYPINTSTGNISTTNPTWTAQGQLDNLSLSNRYIGTYNGSAGVAFNWSSLTPAMQSELNSPVTPPGPSDGSAVLSFLRGTRTSETTTYRTRAHVLGDIVDAAPVYVAAPTFGYADSGYQDFFNSNSNRQPVIYQGANDGMLHAFSAANGAELWAYVPGLLFNSRLSGYPQTSTLVNLSMLKGFTHLYYVDSTPFTGDVDMSNTVGASGAANWKTILVGGLGKGGNGYYALDITTPTASSDTAVASKVLWEFPNGGTPATTKANIGFSYGQPLLVKTKAAGWVVLVTSGYNNGSTTGGDGKGHLYVLNPANGTVISDISTGAGTPTSPSGLAQISAFAYDGNIDATIDYVYGGDLQGNVWRFDLSGAQISNWNKALLATLADANGSPQPVTTAPQLTIAQGHRMVYVGTGEYLGMSDVPGMPGSNSSAGQTQTIYGLWDNQSATPQINQTGPLRSDLIKQTITLVGNVPQVTSMAAPNFTATQAGWYADFPSVGERVNVSLNLIQGTLEVVTNIPSGSDPCQPGGSSYQYYFNYLSGSGIDSSTAGIFLGNHLSSGDVNIQVGPPDGPPQSQQSIGVTQSSNGNPESNQNHIHKTQTTVNRVQWREILTQ